ncbi:hypothetical protein NA56DRAFT_77582 [Hyaloscypha hepaticicola]|uniref:Uncharacterized protein n=1 Tax=Hyaloscypha hepaticicola TaxID=2082293 RepID=A0A2J6Q9D2_9HELO|nr:hypothetical protein NA56DRAFT_77582 [Hyaloscypha hepaticicola]
MDGDGHGFRDVDTVTQYEVRMYSLDFGVCNADRISGLCATVQAGTATSLILNVSAFLLLLLLPLLPQQLPNGHIWLLPALHCLRQIRTTSRDETAKGLLALCTTTFGTPAPPIHAESQFEHTGCLPVHTPKPSVGCQNPTCRSGAPIDMLQALRPRPLPWSWHLALPKNCDYNNCKLALCKKESPLVSRILHPSKFPSMIPHISAIPGPYFPIPLPDARGAVAIQLQ